MSKIRSDTNLRFGPFFIAATVAPITIFVVDERCAKKFFKNLVKKKFTDNPSLQLDNTAPPPSEGCRVIEPYRDSTVYRNSVTANIIRDEKL